jgi:hypothetical protein
MSELINLVREAELVPFTLAVNIQKETDELLTSLTLREHQMTKVAEMIRDPESYLTEKKEKLEQINENAVKEYAKKVQEFRDAGMPLLLAKNLAKPLVKNWLESELSKVEFEYPESVGNAGIDFKLSGPAAKLKALEQAKIE